MLTSEDLEERRLARAVRAQQEAARSGFELEVHLLDERPLAVDRGAVDVGVGPVEVVDVDAPRGRRGGGVHRRGGGGAAAAGAACAVVVAAGASPSSAFRLASAAKGPAVSITVGAVSTPPPAPLFHPDAATGTGMFVLKVGVSSVDARAVHCGASKRSRTRGKASRASTWRLTRDAWIVIEFLHCKVVRNMNYKSKC